MRLPGLFLIGQTSMFTYKSTGAKPREVAQELGVRHVLEGTVRREQNRVRITAQLIEGASGRHVWAERYDRTAEDVFAVQDEITEQVVTALDVALVGGRGREPPGSICGTHKRWGSSTRGLSSCIASPGRTWRRRAASSRA